MKAHRTKARSKALALYVCSTLAYPLITGGAQLSEDQPTNLCLDGEVATRVTCPEDPVKPGDEVRIVGRYEYNLENICQQRIYYEVSVELKVGDEEDYNTFRGSLGPNQKISKRETLKLYFAPVEQRIYRAKSRILARQPPYQAIKESATCTFEVQKLR